MELEFDKRGVAYLQPLLREVQTQEQTQELRLSDGMPDLGRVLGTWGQVILRSKEWRGDRVSISGGVMVFVLYAPEDGSEMKTLESWIPFQMKWDLEDGQREGELQVQCLLRFLEARVVSARKVMLRCGISAMGQAFRRETAMVSIPGQVPEHVQLLKNRYPLRLPVEAGEKAFQLEEELTLPDAAVDWKQLVSQTLEPQLSECRVLNEKLVLRGSCRLHLAYLNRTGQVESSDLEIPFSQLAELTEEYSGDAQGTVLMSVTSVELESASEGRLHLKAGLLAQYVVDRRELLELVEDAYSPERMVEIRTANLELPMILERQHVSIPVRQTLRQDAREIADVTYLPEFPTQYRGDNVQLELPGQFQVLWYDESNTLQSANLRTEEHWDSPAGEDTRIHAAVLPGEPPSARAGNGIEVKGESILEIAATSRQGIPMITGLTIGEELPKEPSRPSLILRRAGTGGLWNIAKSTGSTMAAIRQANSLEEDPDPDRILLIPVS